MAADNLVTHVLVDLTVPVPVGGHGHVLIRVGHEDRETIQIAAQALGIKQADFVRTAVVQAARKVIQENAR